MGRGGVRVAQCRGGRGEVVTWAGRLRPRGEAATAGPAAGGGAGGAASVCCDRGLTSPPPDSQPFTTT